MSTTAPTPYVGTNVSHYTKSIVYLLGAALVVLQPALTDSYLSTAEWLAIGIAVVGAVPTYFATSARYVKLICTVALAALQAVALLVGPSLGLGDVSASAWVGVILAALTAAGVGILPNEPKVEYVDPRTLFGDDVFESAPSTPPVVS